MAKITLDGLALPPTALCLGLMVAGCGGNTLNSATGGDGADAGSASAGANGASTDAGATTDDSPETAMDASCLAQLPATCGEAHYTGLGYCSGWSGCWDEGFTEWDCACGKLVVRCSIGPDQPLSCACTLDDIAIDMSYCQDPALPCESPYVNCDGSCVLVTSSTDNCGACGQACAKGYICDAGGCVLPGAHIE